jgi:hypothetical protein
MGANRPSDSSDLIVTGHQDAGHRIGRTDAVDPKHRFDRRSRSP